MTRTITKTQISNLKQTAKMASNPLRKIAMLNQKIQKLEAEIEEVKKEYSRYNDWVQQDFGYNLDELMIMTPIDGSKGYSLEYNPEYFNITFEERVDKLGRKMVYTNVEFKDNTTSEQTEETKSEIPTAQEIAQDFNISFPEE